MQLLCTPAIDDVLVSRNFQQQPLFVQGLLTARDASSRSCLAQTDGFVAYFFLKVHAHVRLSSAALAKTASKKQGDMTGMLMQVRISVPDVLHMVASPSHGCEVAMHGGGVAVMASENCG